MELLDAVVEMKKDENKVFRHHFKQGGHIDIKIVDNKLGLKYKDSTNDSFLVRTIMPEDYGKDWVEVKEWDEVSYAEFMAWYCIPKNKNKKYKCRFNNSTTYYEEINSLSNSPSLFIERFDKFYITNGE